MTRHTEPHPQAGQTVTLTTTPHTNHLGAEMNGAEYRIEDWWDHLTGGSWMVAEGNPAALLYAMRAATVDLPIDDEVVYGKIGNLGHLVHVTELGEPV